jgi:hypothetical protein
MPELELGKEEGLAKDPFAQKIGIAAAVIGAVLAVATIGSHRAHTSSVVLRTQANDQWSLYQAKRIKSHTAELGADLLAVLKPDSELRPRYVKEAASNDQDSKKVQEEARSFEEQSEVSERQALRYDIGEGLLEIGLVLCSLFFVSGRRMFTVLGIGAGLAGAIVAATGVMLH